MNDPLVHIEMDRKERSRVEKKLKNLLYKRGYNNLNKINNIEDMIREENIEEELPQFKFDNEKKSNKETFNKYTSGDYRVNNKNCTGRPKRNTVMEEHSLYSKRYTNAPNSHNSRNMTMNLLSSPLFVLEIKIDDLQNEKLEFFAQDDPILVADRFCLKYGLVGENKTQIKEMISDRLMEI